MGRHTMTWTLALAGALLLSACGSTPRYGASSPWAKALTSMPCLMTSTVSVNCASTKAYSTPTSQVLPSETAPVYTAPLVELTPK